MHPLNPSIFHKCYGFTSYKIGYNFLNKTGKQIPNQYP